MHGRVTENESDASERADWSRCGRNEHVVRDERHLRIVAPIGGLCALEQLLPMSSTLSATANMSTSQTNPRAAASVPAEPKARGANRSTKVAGKLKVLPDQPEPVVPKDRLEPAPTAPPRRDEAEGSATAGDSDEDVADDEEDTEDVEVRSLNGHTEPPPDYSPDVQSNRPYPGWHSQERRITFNQEESKVTSTRYCLCNRLVSLVFRYPTRPRPHTEPHPRSYRFPELMRFFNARRSTYHTNPRIIDEVIYTPYAYDPSGSRHVHFNSVPRSSGNESQNSAQGAEGDLLGVPELAPRENNSNGFHTAVSESNQAATVRRKKSKFEEVPTEAEIFLFQYGTVVIWGMTEAEEKRFLSSM